MCCTIVPHHGVFASSSGRLDQTSNRCRAEQGEKVLCMKVEKFGGHEAILMVGNQCQMISLAHNVLQSEEKM